ncbi:hypothetical protein ACET3X_009283 [Alternaria dauci]|uniref:Zn(2)-C6 fungal-type domain-containing protein n=1 Tax=Alternaria dauci TaxID=48095 RepID=A0ABR3U8E4_9PLEO
MAEAITVPSSSFVLKPPESAPIDIKPARKTASASCPAPTKASDTAGVTKRKQSKSRNGCVTCKAKRLKCDEKKPTCEQCARRAVTCGGYKKDFKWRPFEEPSSSNKAPTKSRQAPGPQLPASMPSHFQGHSSFQDHQYAFFSAPQNAYYPPPQHSYPFIHGPPLQTSFSQPSFVPTDNLLAVSAASPFIVSPMSISPAGSYAPGSFGSQSVLGAESTTTVNTKADTESSASPGQSPRLIVLLQSGTDLSEPPEEYSSFVSQHEAFYQPTGLTPPTSMQEDEIEQLVYDGSDYHAHYVTRIPSPSPSSSSSSSSNSPDSKIPAQVQLSLTSAESITRRYDRDTCGVLSVKDGPTENPWRTLIWPLTRDCPALYHAIASMTSFHQSKEMPTLRIQGIDHMRNAVHALAAGIQNMRVDAAISTTLVLAFAESWDQHISTGINHIKGARILINRALVQYRHKPKHGEEWTRLKFLCNTWIYMDVLARLTSADDDDAYDVDAIQESIYATGEIETTLDPLMGCAHTLFPIIGRVANLVRKVRRSDSNGPTIISQAVQLKSQLEDWSPPSFIEDPEDETTSPHDTIKTALAYRTATLLYLHQAVPEIPSEPPSVLAKRVLCDLATVHPRSRSIIIHIFPLMAAGCEAAEPDEREWVTERWRLMSSRMKLGIIERCLEVTKEVWSRRDARASERMLHMNDMRNHNFSLDAPLEHEDGVFSTDFDGNGDHCCQETSDWKPSLPNDTETLDGVVTVKDRLHWLSVMKEWQWEILLG